MRDLVILLIDETGLAVAIPILPIGSWLGQTPLSSVPTDEPKQTNKQTTASQSYTNGGCRGTVVGAVVEIEQADEAEVRRGGMRIREFASIKVTTCRRGETVLGGDSRGHGEMRSDFG